MTTEEICEYDDCTQEATVYDDSIKAWLCPAHEHTVYDFTDYCSRNCMLGYGCDGSC